MSQPPCTSPRLAATRRKARGGDGPPAGPPVPPRRGCAGCDAVRPRPGVQGTQCRLRPARGGRRRAHVDAAGLGSLRRCPACRVDGCRFSAASFARRRAGLGGRARNRLAGPLAPRHRTQRVLSVRSAGGLVCTATRSASLRERVRARRHGLDAVAAVSRPTRAPGRAAPEQHVGYEPGRRLGRLLPGGRRWPACVARLAPGRPMNAPKDFCPDCLAIRARPASSGTRAAHASVATSSEARTGNADWARR